MYNEFDLSFLPSSVWTHRYLFYTLNFNLIYFTYFFLRLFQLYPLRNLINWLLGLFNITTLLCFLKNTFLLSGIIRCSSLNLCTCYPSPRISHFSKDLWFHLLDNGIINLDLGAKCVPWYWSDFASSLQSKEQGYMCI